MKCARAKRAKLLFFIVKHANLRRSCLCRCHGYLSSLFFKDMTVVDYDDDDDDNRVLGVVVVDHNDKKWDTRKEKRIQSLFKCNPVGRGMSSMLPLILLLPFCFLCVLRTPSFLPQ